MDQIVMKKYDINNKKWCNVKIRIIVKFFQDWSM